MIKLWVYIRYGVASALLKFVWQMGHQIRDPPVEKSVSAPERFPLVSMIKLYDIHIRYGVPSPLLFYKLYNKEKPWPSISMVKTPMHTYLWLQSLGINCPHFIRIRKAVFIYLCRPSSIYVLYITLY